MYLVYQILLIIPIASCRRGIVLGVVVYLGGSVVEDVAHRGDVLNLLYDCHSSYIYETI